MDLETEYLNNEGSLPLKIKAGKAWKVAVLSWPPDFPRSTCRPF